jgi:hypothetical protein
MIQHIEIGKNALVKHGCTLVKMSRQTKPGRPSAEYAYSHPPSAASKSLDTSCNICINQIGEPRPCIQEFKKCVNLALERRPQWKQEKTSFHTGAKVQLAKG